VSVKKIGVMTAGVIAAGGLALGGATMASAAPAPAPSAGAHGPHGPRGTAVTGDEAAKVTAAVTAKDAAVTVSRVVKGADGSYHVSGTKDGKRVHFKVSADLKTVTEGKGGPGRGSGKGGHGKAFGTAVTGDEATKVTAAVTAEDASVTVSRVVKTADGAYHVFGTKDGKRVHFKVTADLKTVTEGKAGPERGGDRPAPAPSKSS
jgi:hypothetical protein